MTLSAKALEIKIKAGATSEEIARYFGCESNELDGLIRKHLSEKASNGYLKKIARNNKRKKTHQSEKSPSEETVQILQSEESIVEEAVEILQSEESNVDNVEENLSKLQNALDCLKEKLNLQELLHQKVESERHQIRSELQKRRKSLQDILKQIETEETEITSLQERISETGNRMLMINGVITSIRDEIVSTEEKISLLKKVSVLVFDSGILETSVTVPETWKKIFEELVKNEALGDFKANQVRGLSKAKSIKEAYPELTFEFAFETQELERFL